nr:heavy-metal-associated domain-containing protein [Collinsella tanakaei]
MTCAACQAHVDKAVCKLDGVQEVAVNLLSGSMTVDFDPDRVSAEEICSAVDRAGYTASLAGGSSGRAGHGRGRRGGRRRALDGSGGSFSSRIAHKEAAGDRRCHEGAPCGVAGVFGPVVLHRHGPYARLAATRRAGRP